MLLLLSFVFALAQAQLTVSTEYGSVLGAMASPSVRAWRGIPFASPPTGKLRFASPVPPTPWAPNVKDCTIDNSHICPQGSSVDGIVLGNEDCLYMDIYSPANATAASKLPVMVWFYGGGYTLGDKREFGLYDATNIVGAHNYVHVALNYRLSVLGFLALPGLQAENAAHSTGNYALQDQQTVLRFVQKNIVNFGGDPTKVTIFGESAGAFSVCWHLVSPTSKGLFRSAIMESGNCESPGFFYPVKDAFVFGKSYSDTVGCNSSLLNDQQLVTCMRSLPAGQVLDGGVELPQGINMPNFNSETSKLPPWRPLLYPIMPWGPAIDGSQNGLLDVPLNLLNSGRFNKVPLILGTNKNEGNIFVPAFPWITGQSFPLTEATFTKSIAHFFNETTATTITKMYYSSASTWEGVCAVVLRDFFFGCSARRYAAAFARSQVPVYLYHFTFSAPDWFDQWILGDYHSSELEFVFANPWPPLIHVFDPEDVQMAATFGGYWTNLAATGNPNTGPAGGLMSWPLYNPSNEQIMDMTVPTTIGRQYLENVCPFWDSVTIINH